VPAALGQRGVVQDQVLDRRARPQRRDHLGADPLAHRGVAPVRLGDEVLDRLMAARDVVRVEPLGSMLLRPPGSSSPPT
jgi:hypothetical protein